MINRRSFLQKSSLAGLAWLFSRQVTGKDFRNSYKMGYQLFSVNQDMNSDPKGSLKALKAMGYEDFEIYGFDPKEVSYYGLKADDLKIFLDDLGCTVTSGHYGFTDYFNSSKEELRSFVDQCIKGAKALKAPYITWPFLAPELRKMENYKKLSELLNLIGEQVSSAGLGFAYHNHGFEFEEENGQTGYDIILEKTDPNLVKLQMDMYWVMHSSKLTPKEWVAKQPGRFVMWHLKDMDKITRDYTELGNGSIDYTAILPDPKTSGLEYLYIEQGGNFTHSALKSAADSAKYFKSHLKQFF